MPLCRIGYLAHRFFISAANFLHLCIYFSRHFFEKSHEAEQSIRHIKKIDYLTWIENL